MNNELLLTYTANHVTIKVHCISDDTEIRYRASIYFYGNSEPQETMDFIDKAKAVVYAAEWAEDFGN